MQMRMTWRDYGIFMAGAVTMTIGGAFIRHDHDLIGAVVMLVGLWIADWIASR